jgi:hypothetical protein
MKDLHRNISFRHDFININFEVNEYDGGADCSDSQVAGLLEKNKNVSNVNVHDFCSVIVDYSMDDLHYTGDVVPFESGTYNTFTYIVGNTLGYLKSCNIYYPIHDQRSFISIFTPNYDITFDVGGKELTSGHN